MATRTKDLLLMSLAAFAAHVAAQPQNGAAKTSEPGSTAFCLFEIPIDDGTRRRWVNLGIVQYVDIGNTDIKVAFGGGNLGSGHEVKIPVASRDDGLAFVDRMRRAAGECRRTPAG